MNALIVVDIQNDFLPDGALAVKEGDQIIMVVNKLMKKFEFVVATQDWHPAGHGSFASNHKGKKPGDMIELNGLDQILWPDHCVQHTRGSEFSKELDVDQFKKIFKKGSDILIDSYSGFFDNGKRRDTGLNGFLKSQDIDTVFVVGLATDYCVKYTAIDASELGYRSFVIPDATRAVNLDVGDFEKSIEDMIAKGVGMIYSREIL